MKPILFLALFFLAAPVQKSFADAPPAPQEMATEIAAKPQLIDIKKVFIASPLIYSLLSMMSVASLAIWLYSLATFRPKEIMPEAFRDELKAMLEVEGFDQARLLCDQRPNILSSLIKAGLTTRNLGPQVMIDSMKSEGKRASTPFWQRLSLLNDIAIVAPMLGLLGTVIGMF